MMPLPKSLRRAVLAVLGVAVMALSPPSFAGNTTQVGTSGPSDFDVSCKGRDLLIGVSFVVGRDVDQIEPICQPRNKSGFTGKEYRLGQFGSRTTGSVGGTARCPFNMAIGRMHVYVDNQSQIHRFTLTCKPTSVDVVQPVFLKGPVNPPGTGGVDKSGGSVQCPSGELANGMIGGYTSSVHRLGLKCGPFQMSGGGGGDDEGEDEDEGPPPDNGGGKTRTAREATTIYDKPDGNDVDYLDEGDTVIIVSCEDGGEGWCKISKPRKGYVWGGDLN